MERQINWTHASVLRFADGRDPIAAVEEAAQRKVLQALDSGWQGPPFNPLALADLLQIPVEANAEVRDARAVPNNGGVKIQFNPTQPRERVRFSIAHEVAHTLFPDVAEAVRHRGGDLEPDNWQLEMLCNIAAAEFIMPIGSLPPSDNVPSLEALLVERRKFDVSAEAFLIRVAKVASEPLFVFCASPTGGLPSQYRIDYVVTSRGWTPLIKGSIPPTDTVLAECSAIGYTSHRIESWSGAGEISIECVGIPAYPGGLLPRVAGIARPPSRDVTQPSSLIKYINGDVLSPRGAGEKILCMLVNDSARRWGGGIARNAAQKFPTAEKSYSDWLTGLPKRNRLGSVHVSEVGAGLFVASLIGQEGYGPSDHPRIKYSALSKCLDNIVGLAKQKGASLHMPKLGAGAAGGDWRVVEQILMECLTKYNICATVYEPPPKRAGIEAELFP